MRTTCFRVLAAIGLTGPAHALAEAPDTIPNPQVQAIYTTGAFAGQPDSAGILPNFNKVPGTSDFNLDIAAPQAVLTHGLTYTYAVSFQDNSFTGTCAISYILSKVIAGKRTLLDTHAMASTNCSPGNIFMFFINGKPVPDKLGAAQLTGVVKAGGKSYMLNTPVVIK